MVARTNLLLCSSILTVVVVSPAVADCISGFAWILFSALFPCFRGLTKNGHSFTVSLLFSSISSKVSIALIYITVTFCLMVYI